MLKSPLDDPTLSPEKERPVWTPGSKIASVPPVPPAGKTLLVSLSSTRTCSGFQTEGLGGEGTGAQPLLGSQLGGANLALNLVAVGQRKPRVLLTGRVKVNTVSLSTCMELFN